MSMHALITARINLKKTEKRNAPVAECDAAMERLAEIVGMHKAMSYQSAVRLVLQLEHEQCEIVDRSK